MWGPNARALELRMKNFQNIKDFIVKCDNYLTDNQPSCGTDRHSGFRRSGFRRSGLDIGGLDVWG